VRTHAGGRRGAGDGYRRSVKGKYLPEVTKASKERGKSGKDDEPEHVNRERIGTLAPSVLARETSKEEGVCAQEQLEGLPTS